MRAPTASESTGVLAGLITALTLAFAGPARALDNAEGVPVSRPFVFSDRLGLGDRYQGVRILSALELLPRRIDGVVLTELSGIAWDEDEQVLYAVSDEGALFHFQLRFDGGTLAEVRATGAFPLADGQGKPLPKADRDAEDLALLGAHDGNRGNTVLGLAFERRPRLEAYDPRGRRLRALPMAASYRDVRHFRSPNKALESIGYLPDYGWITAPEYPLRGERTIGIRDAEGRHFAYPRFPAPHSALVSLVPLADGSLLTLDRSFDRATASLVVALRRTEPLRSSRSVTSTRGEDAHPVLDVRTIAVFESSGEIVIDNFEGLAAIGPNRFLMVSDDNQHFLQRTLLFCFSLLDQTSEPVSSSREKPGSSFPARSDIEPVQAGQGK